MCRKYQIFLKTQPLRDTHRGCAHLPHLLRRETDVALKQSGVLVWLWDQDGAVLQGKAERGCRRTSLRLSTCAEPTHLRRALPVDLSRRSEKEEESEDPHGWCQ